MIKSKLNFITAVVILAAAISYLMVITQRDRIGSPLANGSSIKG